MDDVQSWWEVPSIAHFCSLFRAAFNLLDFDIEELEEALLTDGTEDTGSSLLQELIVRLLCGCYGRNHGISIFNYQMFLRRLFRTKCREYGRENPFDSDIDFQFLPLRTKVEILQALCDFRLDADDVLDCLKNLESDSLRLQPLGYDRNKSAYWYFYGTRLYREDYPKVKKKEPTPPKRGRKRIRPPDPSEEEAEYELDLGAGVWQVVCYTEEDWAKLAVSTENAPCKEEKTLHHVLTEDFLPEIPRLFEEKRNLQRKRLLEMAPRRQSTRIEKLKHSKEEERKIQKKKEEEDRRQREEEEKIEEEWRKHKAARERQKRIEARERGERVDDSRSNSEDRWTTEGDNSSMCSYQTSTGGFAASTGGRQTNNSLSAAMGQIIIPQQPVTKKLKSSQVFRTSEEDLRIGMYKIMNRVKNHEDAWPFCEPVDEEIAPNYYKQIKKPMDLTRMEDKLDEGRYKTLADFRTDFQLIVDNCKDYNGLDNEYTDMVRRLQQIFRESVSRYLPDTEDRVVSSASEDDEEVPVEFPSPEGIKVKGKRGRKKKIIVMSPRSITPTDEEEDKENEDKSGTPFDSVPSNSDSEREREEVESIKSLSNNEPTKPPKRRRGRPSKERVNNIPKNSSAAIEALELVTEQTLKDINKWLDDTPRFSEYSNSASNSPSQILGIVEDYESRARIEAEYQRTLSKIDKIDKAARKEALQQKRRQMKEQNAQAAATLAAAAPPPPKKKREIQRTIERLQPGKSKGNLLCNTTNTKQEEPALLPLGSKIREKDLLEEKDELVSTPQLSLGTVLTSDVIGFGIGAKQHSFSDEENSTSESKELTSDSKTKEDVKSDQEESQDKPKSEDNVVLENVNSKINEDENKQEAKEVSEDVEKEIEKEKCLELSTKIETEIDEDKKPASPAVVNAPLPSKKPEGKEPKPNFNAWFKAFGAPKAPVSAIKRKADFSSFGNPSTPLSSSEFRDSPEMRSDDTMDEPPPTPGRSLGLDEDRLVALPMASPDTRPGTRRQRKLSTGSSMSERSSFSQDPADPLNSPRPSLDEPYVSPQEIKPYHHSPSNGPIKVGFYQDTFPRAGSDKSSSCSPRDQVPSNNNSPHLQIVSPVQSPKEPYVYSNPMSPYPSPGVYDVPPPTPSYPGHSSTIRDLPYFDRNPVYSSAAGTMSPRPASPMSPPEKPPPTPTSMYPVKKRIYNEIETNLQHGQHQNLHQQHQRLIDHYSDPRFYPNPTLHSPYTNESPLGYSNKPKQSDLSYNTTTTSSHSAPSTSDNAPLNYSNAPLNYARPMSSASPGAFAPTDYSHSANTDPTKNVKPPPPSQYEQLISQMSARFNSPNNNSSQMSYPNQEMLGKQLGYSHPMYNYSDLIQNKFSKAPQNSNYPISFNRPMSPQVFASPNDMLYQEPPAKKPAKKPRKKKNQTPVQETPVTSAPSISSGSNTAFQQYMGNSGDSGIKPNTCLVPGTAGYNFGASNIKDGYSYLEDMRNSGYFLSESASPNVKTSTNSPFFLPGSTRPPGYSSLAQSSLAQSSLAQSSLAQSSLAQSSLAQSSLAQSSLAQFMTPSSSTSPALYQQYLQSRSEQLMRPMMLGYPPGYLNMPPHERPPPWGL